MQKQTKNPSVIIGDHLGQNQLTRPITQLPKATKWKGPKILEKKGVAGKKIYSFRWIRHILLTKKTKNLVNPVKHWF